MICHSQSARSGVSVVGQVACPAFPLPEGLVLFFGWGIVRAKVLQLHPCQIQCSCVVLFISLGLSLDYLALINGRHNVLIHSCFLPLIWLVMPLQAELFTLLALATVAHSPILVLANKQDCAEAMAVADISKALALTSIKSHDWHIQACCALTGEGLSEALEWVSQKTTAASAGTAAGAGAEGQQSASVSQQHLQQQQQHKQVVQPVR